jgi:cell division protein FtsN
MFESRRRGGGGNSANRWLIVAGAGLVILAFVARMLLDVGHTRVSDLAGALRPDTANATPATASAVEPAAALPTVRPVASDTPAAAPPDTVATPAPPAPARMPVPPGSRYVVQIGAFGSAPNAEKLSRRATALGFQAAVITQVRGGTTLYLVRVMRSGSVADARMVSDSLASALGVKAVVLRPGQ